MKANKYFWSFSFCKFLCVLIMQDSENNKDTSYLRVGVLPKLASGSLRWMGVEPHERVVSPLLLHLLLLHLLNGVESLAGLSLPSLGRLDVLVQ